MSAQPSFFGRVADDMRFAWQYVTTGHATSSEQDDNFFPTRIMIEREGKFHEIKDVKKCRDMMYRNFKRDGIPPNQLQSQPTQVYTIDQKKNFYTKDDFSFGQISEKFYEQFSLFDALSDDQQQQLMYDFIEHLYSGPNIMFVAFRCYPEVVEEAKRSISEQWQFSEYYYFEKHNVLAGKKPEQEFENYANKEFKKMLLSGAKTGIKVGAVIAGIAAIYKYLRNNNITPFKNFGSLIGR